METTIQKEINNYRFYKEESKWYIDLPEWTGDKASLQMVAGADDMLDLYSDNTDEVVLQISQEPIEGFDELFMTALAEDMGEGAYYTVKTFKGEVLNLEIWLCGVTEWVFGTFPPFLYIAKI